MNTEETKKYKQLSELKVGDKLYSILDWETTSSGETLEIDTFTVIMIDPPKIKGGQTYKVVFEDENGKVFKFLYNNGAETYSHGYHTYHTTIEEILDELSQDAQEMLDRVEKTRKQLLTPNQND